LFRLSDRGVVMQKITKEVIDILVRLQKAETEIVRIKAFFEELDEEKSKLASRLSEFESALEGHRAAFEKTAVQYRETEAEIQIIDDRVIKSNENLRKVATNKEYQALRREVDDNAKRKEKLENLLIEQLEEMESKEALVKEREAEFQQLSEKIRSEQKEVNKKGEDDRERLAEFRQQREDIGRDLDSDLMGLFNEVSETSGGMAVAEVKQEVCRGCFMNIPPQLYIEVQRCQRLIQCPQCNRILYFKQEDTVEAD